MTTTTPQVSETPAEEPDEIALPSTASGLTTRLAILDRLVEHGAGRIDQTLIDDASDLLTRAGERLGLSGDHTVVALAGGTGSGKSSLFNAVCGLELSPTGLRRPMTGSAHACVWALDGAGPLLDWLDVDPRHRYARASALDRAGESGAGNGLQGLVLLDLPDHDSIRAAHLEEAEKYVKIADVLVWVLDPQKYADFAVHRRYLEPRAGHTGVTVIVLNQVDRLDPEEIDECVKDLRRLLEAEGMHEPAILTTSAKTGLGVDGFSEVLADAVAARQARVERLIADVDQVIRRFDGMYAAPEPVVAIDDKRAATLVEALADAAGIPAVAEAMESAYELRAVDYVGWPVARLLSRFRSDPLRRMRLVELRDELRGAFSAPVNAQQAHVDNAVQAVTDGVVEDLPPSWRRSVRDAGRSHAEELPERLGSALREIVPSFNHVPGWWWLVRAWQYLLVIAAAVGVFWLGAILAFWAGHLGHTPFRLAGDTHVAPFVALLLACALGLGAFTSAAARSLIALSSVKHSGRMEEQMRKGIVMTARTMVVEPVEDELGVYARFRQVAAEALHYLPA